MAVSAIEKTNIVVRSNRIEVTIQPNTSKQLATINELIQFPSNKTLASVMLYSESDGNCIPFLRTSGTAIYIYARNVSSNTPITTGIYIRALFV